MEKISFLMLRRQMPRIRERLKAGESFILTDRGKVIAVLQPILFSTEGSVEEHARAHEMAALVPLDAVSPQAQSGQTGKVTTTVRTKSKQELADELLRGVRSGKPTLEE